MNDFKVGDRVTYTGNVSEAMVGKVGVVVQSPRPGTSLVFFDHGYDEPYGAYPESLTKLPAPDVITINRADLPEVVERGGVLSAGSGPEECVARGSENPNWLRNRANSNLALADFIEARDKAAEEADRNRAKRRDELAAELAPRAYANLGPNWYGNVGEPLQKAIDRIIDLENKAHE